MRKRNAGKRNICLALALLLCLPPFSSAAEPSPAGPGRPDVLILDGGKELSTEEYERIADYTVEWAEIGDRIALFNPTYTLYHDQAYFAVEEMEAAKNGFVTEMHEQLDELDELIDQLKEKQKLILSASGGSAAAGQSAGAAAQQMVLVLEQSMDTAKAGRRSIRSSITQIARSIRSASARTERALAPLKKQLTRTLQGLVISYAQLEVNRGMLLKQQALYEASVSTGKALEAQGMSTALEQRQKENALEEVRNSLAMLENGESQMKNAIGLQFGFAVNEAFTLGALPEPDLAYIDSIDMEADWDAAVKGNSQVIAAGRTGSGNERSFELRDMTENEAIAAADAAFRGIYAALKEKRMLYDTAGITLRKAELSLGSAQRMHALGMTGRAEKEGMEMQYIVSLAAYETAKNDLLQAEYDYRWAVQGLMNIE